MFLAYMGIKIRLQFYAAVKYSLQITFSFLVPRYPKTLLPTVQLMILLQELC